MDIVRELREWSPQSNLLAKLPVRVQKNLFPHELNVTCVYVVEEFVALGSDAGIVFWYNRSTGEMQKLNTEQLNVVTCLHVVSSVEFMVAAGSACGQVNVFQIQKEVPADLKIAIPLTKSRPIERYTIKNMHRQAVRCVQWSKNGMKLFSGDQGGSVVMTEFDFQLHISKSAEILNETYEIVQLDFRQPWLLVSTIYRAIICERQSDGQWKVSQIGKKDRKVLSDFGATFVGPTRSTSVLCARPGFRFWIADTSGNVIKTVLMKEAMERMNHSTFEVPLMNPGRQHVQLPTNFGHCHLFHDNILVTFNSDCIYFLHLDQQKVVATVRRMRNIRSLCVQNGEIFVLEGTRNVVRISNLPDASQCVRISSPNEPLEFQAEDETQAEECFELPPIETIHLDTPLHTSLDEHDLLLQDKLFLEHSRKVEIFEKINELGYDESIIYKNRALKKRTVGLKVKRHIPSGIVEIGQQATIDEGEPSEVSKHVPCSQATETTRSSAMESSYCLDETRYQPPSVISPLPNLMQHPFVPPAKLPVPSTTVVNPSTAPLYPMKFHDEQMQSRHTTPLKKLYFISDDDTPTPAQLGIQPIDQPHYEFSETITSSVPDVQSVPRYMNIPNLWNVEIEHDNDAVAAGIDIDEKELSSLTSDTSFEIIDF